MLRGNHIGFLSAILNYVQILMGMNIDVVVDMDNRSWTTWITSLMQLVQCTYSEALVNQSLFCSFILKLISLYSPVAF